MFGNLWKCKLPGWNALALRPLKKVCNQNLKIFRNFLSACIWKFSKGEGGWTESKTCCRSFACLKLGLGKSYLEVSKYTWSWGRGGVKARWTISNLELLFLPLYAPASPVYLTYKWIRRLECLVIKLKSPHFIAACQQVNLNGEVTAPGNFDRKIWLRPLQCTTTLWLHSWFIFNCF